MTKKGIEESELWKTIFYHSVTPNPVFGSDMVMIWFYFGIFSYHRSSFPPGIPVFQSPHRNSCFVSFPRLNHILWLQRVFYWAVYCQVNVSAYIQRNSNISDHLSPRKCLRSMYVLNLK